MLPGYTVRYRGIERGLAGLFVGFLGLYAVGTLVEATLPSVHAAGVIAVHLAVVLGFVFATTVLGRAVCTRVRNGRSKRGAVTVGLALVAVCSLVIALLRASAPYSDALLSIAAGGSLLLAGRVSRSPVE